MHSSIFHPNYCSLLFLLRCSPSFLKRCSTKSNQYWKVFFFLWRFTSKDRKFLPKCERPGKSGRKQLLYRLRFFDVASFCRSGQNTVELLAIADRRVAELNEEIRMLEKQVAKTTNLTNVVIKLGDVDPCHLFLSAFTKTVTGTQATLLSCICTFCDKALMIETSQSNERIFSFLSKLTAWNSK